VTLFNESRLVFRGLSSYLQRFGGIVAVKRTQLTKEQADWLTKLLQSRPKRGFVDDCTMPGEVADVLVQKGLVRWWRRGAMEITLDGILAVTRRA